MQIARWLTFGVALVAVLTFSIQGISAAQMGMADALKTAITHAGLAGKSDTMRDVSLHLRHVINCLAGPNDKMFNKAAGNPCQGQGNGIMPDIKAKMGQDQEYHVAWWLAHVAQEAVSMGNLAQAKAAAHLIEVELTSMSKM